ncbi:MAG TPA: hypothetical protein VEZ72_22645 [Paenibacillus sp.]|jgi:predicted DNA-binding transcriptional regulator AlpA|nr:hypothetical protein [Paenibacillus sp.]
MDKRKVITAYRRGFLTIQECAQILGIDSPQIMKLVNDPTMSETKPFALTKSAAKTV